ncbi:protein kinase [Metarhizium brunneum]
MKLHIVALVGAAVGLPLDPANGDGSGEDCYPVDYTPRCAPGKLCSQVAVPGLACPWTCGAPLPDACEERCKPCREEVCPTTACVCEGVCPVGSDGTGAPA